jgi:hypothetical protein
MQRVMHEGGYVGMEKIKKITLKALWIFLLICLVTNPGIAKDTGFYPAKQPSSGDGSIQGILIDKKTNNPVPNISITIFTPGGLVQEWIKTDKNGAFILNNVPSADTFLWLSVKKEPVHNVPIAFFLKDASGNKMKFNLQNREKVDLGKISYEIVNDEIEAICPYKIGHKSKSFKDFASSPLPKFNTELKGNNEIRINNPNDFDVLVGIRAENRGADFEVAANGTASVFIPNGKYEIYFVYSNKPDALFKGDNFSLNNNGIEIEIVKVVGGNYGITQVK